MLITSKNVTTFFLLILAVGLSTWSILLSTQPQVKLIEPSSTEPDAFLENIIATIMTKEGKPRLQLEAPKMVHYPKDDTSHLTQPHVTIYRQSLQPWHINAKHATGVFGTTEITFDEDVVIHHLEDKDNPVTTMNTSTLTILPEEKIAKTSEEVVVKQPNTLIYAVGMLANWDVGTVNLLSKAREEYVPKY